MEQDTLDPSLPTPPEKEAKRGRGRPPRHIDSARLSIPINEAGQVQVDRMQDDTKAKLRAALANGDTRAQLGLDAPQAAPAQPLSPMIAMMAINALSQLEAIALYRMTRAPRDVVMAAAVYTPDEAAMIQEPLEKVINKYAPAAMSKYDAEISLVGVLVLLTLKKADAIRLAMQHRPPATVLPFVPPPAPAGDVAPQAAAVESAPEPKADEAIDVMGVES